MARKNEGKRFEEDFKKSMPDDCFFYRFRDGTGAWGGNDQVRFQSSNICDCMAYRDPYLYLFELKSHKGKSVPFGCIRDNQLTQMNEAFKKGVNALFIFNMRDVEKTYAVYVCDLVEFIENTDRKSIPISFMEDKGYLIPQVKKRVRYRYELDKFLTDII